MRELLGFPETDDILPLLGWDESREEEFSLLCKAEGLPPGASPARVVSKGKDLWRCLGNSVDAWLAMSGKLRANKTLGSWPSVGDWVVVQDNVVTHVLNRRTELARRSSGKRLEKQVLAANVDITLILMGLDQDFNPRRLERFLSIVTGGGLEAVVLLTKADTAAEIDVWVNYTASLAGGIKVIPTSSVTGTGIDTIRELLQPGKTAVLMGTSGVGKSTLLNVLSGRDIRATGAVRETDGRGRHTTTTRDLFLLPSGCMMIDNPGLREVGITDQDSGDDDPFSDIEKIAAACRFNNCAHHEEPGCAVKQALLEGYLPHERYLSYLKLRKESGFVQKWVRERDFTTVKRQSPLTRRGRREKNKTIDTEE